MKLFCAHCLKAFEAPRTREFCCAEHNDAFKKENAAHRKSTRKALREPSAYRHGFYSVAGGRQSINFGDSTER
jgi:hypothetical protein